MDITELRAALTDSSLDVDPFSGACLFKIPLGQILGQINGVPLTLTLSGRLDSSESLPILNFYEVGSWRMGGGSSYGKYEVHVRDVPLINGQTMSADTDDKGSMTAVGPGYVFDATHILTTRKQAFADTVNDFRNKPLKGQSFTVMHTTGVAEIFDCIGENTEGASKPPSVLTRQILESNGKGVKFTWHSNHEYPRVTKIEDSIGTMLTADWKYGSGKAPQLKKITIYPDGGEEVNYEFWYEDDAIEIEVMKLHPFIENKEFRIEKSLGCLQVKTTTHFRGLEMMDREVIETLTWKGSKPILHTVELPGIGGKLLKSWEWGNGRTSITLKSERETAAEEGQDQTTSEPKKELTLLETVSYTYSDGVIRCLTSTSGDSTSKYNCVITSDSKKRTTTSCITQVVDGVELSRTESTFDREGNLIEVKRGEGIIQWTYFNNYSHYSVASGVASDASDLQYVLGYTLLGPLLNKSLNFSSNTIIEYTTLKSSAPNNYAKSAFNLPLDINYPGDELGFNNHVESERIIHKNAQGEVTTKITYFGYDKIITPSIKFVDRKHVVVLARKLTVLMPSLTQVDVTKEQLSIAEKAAKEMIDALNVCVKSVKADDYVREGYEASISAIKASIKQQSELNNKGFKLDTWKGVHMTVEDYTYDTNTSSDFFTKPKTNAVYYLDEDGKKISDSEVLTTFSYEKDNASLRRLTTTTKVKSSNETFEIVQVQDGFANILVERTDAAGITTHYEYADGALSRIKSVQGEAILSDSVITNDAGNHRNRLQTTIKDEKGLSRRFAYDSRGRQCEYWINLTDEESEWLKIRDTNYLDESSEITTLSYHPQKIGLKLAFEERDAHGRSTKLVEYDYTASGDLYDTRTTEWERGVGGITKKLVLKDSNGAIIDSRTQTEYANGRKIVVQQGGFTESYELDASKNQAVYSSAYAGTSESLQLDIEYNAMGKPTLTTCSKKIKDKLSTLTSHAVEYNWLGMAQKITADSNPPLTLEYDLLGRLVKKEKGIFGLVYDYAQHSASPIPVSMSSIHTGEVSGTKNNVVQTKLGVQTIDAWGRLKTRTVNNRSMQFDYSGASLLSRGTPEKINNLFAGYSSTWDPDSMTYAETCAFQDTADGSGTSALTTQLELSVRGRIIKVTDIAGQETHYTYDALDRLVKQTSSLCITSAVYGDGGRLEKEIIQNLTAKRVLTISYKYDLLGREVERSFSSDNAPLIKLERVLSPAGRLERHVLKVGEEQKYSHEYSYNMHGQLIGWRGQGTKYTRQKNDYVQEGYGYDAVGNMTAYGCGTSKNNPDPMVMTTRTFSPDSPGLLTQVHGSSINSKAGRINRYHSYSADGRIASVGWPISHSTGFPELSFKYDTTGRLRALFTAGNNDSPRGFQLHYRADKVYARSQKTTNARFWGGVVEKKDILLNDSVGCYLRQTLSTSSGGSTTSRTVFELRDASGTIFATLNSEGKISALHEYSPYGYREVDSEWDQWLGFNGEVIFPRSLYYLGNYRAYDPELMTFCSPDDTSPFGIGGPATYAFCGGDPVNYHDPSGHSRESHLSAVVAPPIMTTKEFRIALAVGSIITAPIGGGAIAAMCGAVSGGLELASVLIEDSDPQLASTLGVLSFGIGMGGVAAGLEGASRLAGGAARGLSRTPKVLDQTMGGISGYRYFDDTLRIWEDTHKGVRRLVIDIHGVEDGLGNAVGRVAYGDGELGAAEFIELLKKRGVDIDSYGKIKLQSCYSASHYNSRGDSFAKDIARITRKEVKGYKGPMKLSVALGETSDDPCRFVDDPSIRQLLSSDAGKQEVLQAWRPRKIEWRRDANGLPLLDSNGEGIPISFKDFNPVTFRPNITSPQVDEILGVHSVEKAKKRLHKNPNIYSNPSEEVANYERKKNGTLLDYLLDGDSLC
ncbi:RHS repeat-associated core domain-containing protein [Pseudomonas promysalinigenes]|uniref:RHS repeat-associated core domain-containing protein n=1 Tax=Pseudomonas promysalinigenes TaxID=485898 RepID=UPI003916E670